MAEQKSFWKKYDILIVAVLTLLFIYIVVVFNQKINFFLGNELIVNLGQNQKSFDMHYGETRNVEFGISTENAAYCTAACQYTFTDLSRNSSIDSGTFEVEKGQEVKKSYGLAVKRFGSGQDIYNFEVKCKSLRSFICLTSGTEKSRSSLVTVNYELTPAEKELKTKLKINITHLLKLLNEVDILHQQADQKYFELGLKVNFINLTRQKISIDDHYDKSRISIENLIGLWAIENYAKLNEMLNSSYFWDLNVLNTSIAEFDKAIDNLVKIHNSFLAKLNGVQKDLIQLSSIAGILHDERFSYSLYLTSNKFNALSSLLIENKLDSYENVSEAVANITKEKDSAIRSSKSAAADFLFNAEYNADYGKIFLCTLQQNCSENASVEKITLRTEDYLKNHPSIQILNGSCSSLKTIKWVQNNSIAFPSTPEFVQFADSFKDNEMRKINNSYFKSFENVVSENKTSPDAIKIANSTLPKSKAEIKTIYYNGSVNVSMYLLSKMLMPAEVEALLEKCRDLGKQTVKAEDFNFEPISANITYKIVPKIDVSLTDAPPLCCVFGSCRPCCIDESCKNDPKTFPVIFLHGHSFAKGNSPEFSLDSFNKMQSKLEGDGYLNAGVISLYSKNEPLQQGIWGLSGKPITVKASYYYDAFKKDDKYIVVPTKSENIDTYALRLRDLIGIVKERTGKPKVNIVAYSMGGLVARRYLQIFNADDVDKLIMIATPNKGVAGSAADYCGLVGENRECDDMKQNSLFINKLNDPLKQTDKAKLYNLVGQGCKMDSGDGDGVVLAENAKLENAKNYFVNGTCPGFFEDTLHTSMLDIDKYPEVYNMVTEILKE